MRNLLIGCAGLCFALCNRTYAQDPPTLETVTVQGSPSSTAGTYESLIRGVKAHETRREDLSPHSRLFFQVSKTTTALYVEVKDDLIEIPLGSNNTFTLPLENVQPGPWKLLAYGKNGTEILPLVESEITREDRKRLGDLRLQCQVLWAMVQPDIAVGTRALLKMSGGLCNSSVVAIYFPTDRKINAATLSHLQTRFPVKVQVGSTGFSVPLKDKNIPNDAIIALEFD